MGTTLLSSHQYVDGMVQKRWYIYDANETKLFGAIEVGDSPWRVKQWRRIGGAFEEHMVVYRVHQPCVDIRALVKIKKEFGSVGGLSAALIQVAVVRSLWLTMRSDKATPDSIAQAGSADMCVQFLLRTLEDNPRPADFPLDSLYTLCSWVRVMRSYRMSRPCVAAVHALSVSPPHEGLDFPALWLYLRDALLPTPPRGRAEFQSQYQSEQDDDMLALLSAADEHTQTHPLRNSWSSPEPVHLPLGESPWHCFRPVTTSVEPIEQSDELGGLDSSALDIAMAYLQGGVGNAVSRDGHVQSLNHANDWSCMWKQAVVRLSTDILQYEMDARTAYAYLQAAAPVLRPPSQSLGAEGKDRDGACFSQISALLAGRTGELPAEFTEQGCGTVCERLIARATVSGGPYRDILYQSCYYLSTESMGNFVPTSNIHPGGVRQEELAVSTDDKLSLANSLLASEAVDAAVAVVLSVLEVSPMPPFDPEEANSITRSTLERAGFLIDTGSMQTISGSEASVDRLSNMFSWASEVAAVPLSYQQRNVLSTPRLLSAYLSCLLQVASRTIQPAVVDPRALLRVREKVSRTLQRVADLCSSASGLRCDVDVDMLSAAAKGIFLLAYQVDPLNSFQFDHSIPFQYSRIVISAESLTVSPYSYPSAARRPAKSSTGPTNIRVAWASAFWFRHSVGRLLGEVILSLRRSTFHVIILQIKGTVAGRNKVDDLTQSLRYRADEWSDTSRLRVMPQVLVQGGVSGSAEAVRDLQVDVLVFGDVLMDAYTTHLAMIRMAPVQVAFWGHPYSSGFPSIDYFITADSFQPHWESEIRRDVSYKFGEQLVAFETLSSSFLSTTEPTATAGQSVFSSRLEAIMSVASLGLDIDGRSLATSWADSLLGHNGAEHVRLYACLQSLMKMHPTFDAVIAQILLRDPQAVVLLSSSVNSKFLSQELFQSRLGRYLATMGADSFRVVLIPQGPSIMYNKILCASDVSIDTFPFGGGVTLSDALRCAVPFVTSGELQGVHRIGEGIARQIALEDVLVAENEVDFVTKALFLANSTLSCRKRHFWSAGLHEAYSTCEFPLLPSPADNTDICDLRSRLCAGKWDSGLFPEERSLGEHHTAVTAEWEEFLRRVHYVQSVRS